MSRDLILKDRSEKLTLKNESKDLVFADRSQDLEFALILPIEKDFLLIGDDSFLQVGPPNDKLIV